eukprot:6684617-Prymnesium_polylepis.1
MVPPACLSFNNLQTVAGAAPPPGPPLRLHLDLAFPLMGGKFWQPFRPLPTASAPRHPPEAHHSRRPTNWSLTTP